MAVTVDVWTRVKVPRRPHKSICTPRTASTLKVGRGIGSTGREENACRLRGAIVFNRRRVEGGAAGNVRKRFGRFNNSHEHTVKLASSRSSRLYRHLRFTCASLEIIFAPLAKQLSEVPSTQLDFPPKPVV